MKKNKKGKAKSKTNANTVLVAGVGAAVKKKSKKKAQKEKCPYDDFACRVYQLCGTAKCMNRGMRLAYKNENF